MITEFPLKENNDLSDLTKSISLVEKQSEVIQKAIEA